MDSRPFVDRGMARFVAGLIGALALFGMAMTWHLQQRTDAGGNPLAAAGGAAAVSNAPAANPKYTECTQRETETIGKMLADGFIDQAKHDDFLANALQRCAGMFPPES